MTDVNKVHGQGGAGFRIQIGFNELLPVPGESFRCLGKTVPWKIDQVIEIIYQIEKYSSGLAWSRADLHQLSALHHGRQQ